MKQRKNACKLNMCLYMADTFLIHKIMFSFLRVNWVDYGNILTKYKILGPVVQSVVSLMSSLRVISLVILADSIYSILIFFAEKM